VDVDQVLNGSGPPHAYAQLLAQPSAGAVGSHKVLTCESREQGGGRQGTGR
jgi:hypothetical protein